jgi:hypothetical protein
MYSKLKDLFTLRRLRDPIRYSLALALVAILVGIMPACSSKSSTATSTTPTTIPTTPAVPGATQRPGANGTLTKIDGKILTLTTTQGEVTVNVGADTSFQETRAGTLADLQEGQSLTVIGAQDASGNITATSITIQPQDQGAPFTLPAGVIPNASGTGGRLSQGTSPLAPPTGAAPNTGGTGGRAENGTTPAFPGGGTVRGAVGSLTKIDGNTLTLTTTQGEVKVSVAADTPVEATVVGVFSDLKEGQSLIVTGTKDANGAIMASAIMIQPEGRNTRFTPPTATPTTTPSPTPGTVQINIGIFSDAGCTIDAKNIDWGSLKPGATPVTIKVYVKDLSNQTMTVTISVPSTVSTSGVTFTNSGPLNLVSSQRPGVWVLTMSLAISSTAQSGDFNFDVSFSGGGPSVSQFTMIVPSHVSIVAP